MTCQKCKKRNTCTKPCEKIEKYLKKQGIYSADWIRPERSSKAREDGKGKWREIPFSALFPQDKAKIRRKYGEIDEI